MILYHELSSMCELALPENQLRGQAGETGQKKMQVSRGASTGANVFIVCEN